MVRVFLGFVASLFVYGILLFLLNHLSFFDENKLVAVRTKHELKTQEQFVEFYDQLKGAGLILEVIDSKNFILLLAISSIFVFISFATLHMFFDKLFFKSFYQQPSLKPAFMRSGIVTALLMYSFGLRVIGERGFVLPLFGLIIAVGISWFILEPALREKQMIPRKLGENEIENQDIPKHD